MFRIQHLQWLGAGVAAIGCLILGGAAVLTNMNDYDRFSTGTQELRRFVTVLDVANAVSAERGPANTAMSATPEQVLEARVALNAKRADTNAALSRMEAALIAGAADNPERLTIMIDLRRTLQNGRDQVDEVIETSPLQRGREQIPHAINAMFRAADGAADLRNAVAGHIVAATPHIAGEVMLVSSASALREQAGRLGSYVVMTLVSPSDDDDGYRLLMDQTNAIMRNLWTTGLSNAGQFTNDGDVQFLVDTVEKEFFGSALPRAMATAAILGPDNGMSGGDFTAVYVPGMASLEALRAALVRNSLDMLETRRDQARQAVFNSAALTGVILAVLVVVAIIFRRALFEPLETLHDQVSALASGNLSEPVRALHNAREVNDIFDGLMVLRGNQREKRLLEDKQRKLNQQLKRLSETDMLTGLLNRRALTNRAELLFRRADITGEDMAVVLFDVDHFKSVNDTYGHAVGDEVLAGVAKSLSRYLRPGDAFARIGGEEFVVILRRVNLQQARQLTTRLQQRLSEQAVQANAQIKVTASFGLTMRLSRSAQSWDDIFRLADQHLYAAKHAGRNRIVSDTDLPTKLRLVSRPD